MKIKALNQKIVSFSLAASMLCGFASIPQLSVVAVDNDSTDEVYLGEEEASKKLYDEIEIGEDYIIDPKVVRFQLRDNADIIRYVWIVKESSVLKAKSGNSEVGVLDYYDDDMDPIITTEPITTAYKSIYAGGKKVDAPEGNVFIISQEASGLSQDGWGSRGVFYLDSEYPPRYCNIYLNNV